MPTYSVTNLQLFSQLMSEGYSREDLQRVHRAYEIARLLFSGRFIASGRSQLSHCVGTASILAVWGAPAHLVAAGLLHNVYRNGDFGDGKYRISRNKRSILRELLNRDIEEEIANFALLKWNEKTISHFILGKGPLTNNLVFLRLADLLDHNVDGGAFYDHAHLKGKMSKFTNIPPYIIQSALVLGLPGLAKELERVKRNNEASRPFEHFYVKYGRHGGGRVIPSSSVKKYVVRLLTVLDKLLPGASPGFPTRQLRNLLLYEPS